MPLLAELGKFWCTLYYKHVAPTALGRFWCGCGYKDVAPTALGIWTAGYSRTATRSGFSMIPRINYKADAALHNR